MEIPCAAELTDLMGVTRTRAIRQDVLPDKTSQVFISGFSLKKCHEPLQITPAYQHSKAISAQMVMKEVN